METYDLSVEDKHEYVADGILAHNCRYILNACNYDSVPEIPFEEIPKRAYYMEDEFNNDDEYDSLMGELYE